MRGLINHALNLFESHNGLIILTTNHASDIDPAFERRIDYKVTFSKPNKEAQIKILQQLLLPDAPVKDLDYSALFEGIDLSGGLIRNAVEKAFYRQRSLNSNVLTQEMLREALLATAKETSVMKEQRKIIGIRP